jgi:hypothetical protein
MGNFEIVYGQRPERRVMVREFSGRMTKKRWKRLQRWARINTKDHGHCGHEHDCCGCMYKVEASVSYKFNQVTITLIGHYNY